jgi:2-polyprenyl-3-methyl-5-hydroxy-6-metoxy-1,4-benzoquinol methylase
MIKLGVNMVDQKLDSYLTSYTRFNDWLIRRRYQRLKEFFKGDSCLEMGIAEGAGVEDLLKSFKKVTVVDGSKTAITTIKQRFPTNALTGIHSYFETMDFDSTKFDTILMAHILEHVDDPIVVLKQAKRFIAPNGVLIIDVPNGNSLHRQIGVKMGLLGKSTDLNEADISIGHQRVYVPETFKKDIESAGLEIIHFGGMFIKTLSNLQMEKVYDSKQLEVLFEVGENNPDVSAEIYIIAKLK